MADQQGITAGNGFEVDVAAELVDLAQGLGDGNKLLHGVVGRLDDAGGEKETLNIVAFVKVDSQSDDLVRRKTGTRDIGRDAVDAEDAIVGAEVGQQDL